MSCLPRATVTWRRRGSTTTTAIDALGRVTSQVGTNSYSWSYLNGGRIVSATGPFSLDTVGTTLLGSPDSVVTRFLASSTQRYGRMYTYLAAGVPDSVRFTTPGNALRKHKEIIWTNRRRGSRLDRWTRMQ